MFELPDAKRVRRHELNGSDSESHHSSDEEIDSIVREKLRTKLSSALEFSFDFVPAGKASKDACSSIDINMTDALGNEEGTDEPEEFEFRLFASDAAQATKVVLESDKPVELGEGAVLMPSRPLTYYLAPRATGKLRDEFDFAAVSGDEVMAYAQQRWWGCEMPWKVVAGIPEKCSLTLPWTTIATSPLAGSNGGAMRRRAKPCKKMRIKKHINERSERAEREEKERRNMSKEELLRDKKKRANLAKKQRRRAKAKENKLNSRTGTDAEVVAAAMVVDTASSGSGDFGDNK
ncbi:hypothetical protein Cpir12675_003221 [Ceratocystis pirilliformis]|uniref:Uncharacterized protein n=1 Tax=Ceratocystis pirilliformis TaxID=259994 RepID=A0ABR3Z5K4_9PEZI